MPRKKPFSGKQKKVQLQEKRERKAAGSSDPDSTKQKWNPSKSSKNKETTQEHSSAIGGYDPSRFILNFLKETREEIERRKKESQTVAIQFVSENELEVDINEIYQPGSGKDSLQLFVANLSNISVLQRMHDLRNCLIVLDMPKRPSWRYTMSKHQLEQREEEYFENYLNKIHSNFGDKSLSYFEHNLETWRQAWRVIEMCDIIVMVTDVRHPVLHFSPALYDHVVNDLKKPLILVLNKIDLVPASVIAAWTSYFKRLFPSLHVVWFTSFPKDFRTVDLNAKVRTKRRPPRKRVYNTQIGPRELLNTCRDICGDKIDFKSWEEKIDRDLESLGCRSTDSSPVRAPASGDATNADKNNTVNVEDESMTSDERHIDDGILTIGFVGHPNVGKSSLMNGLIGRKVVSTSVTPGHTKYFQTYFLTKTVKLCDSPGLVFPSLIPKQLQILSGIYPVAQVREPYNPVGFLAARIPLVQMLRLEYPQYGVKRPSENHWTPWDICEAWANKRNYRTAMAARPDVYRAANAILRMAVDGRLCLFMRPPGYTENKEHWQQDENTFKLMSLQAKGGGEGGFLAVENFISSDSTSTMEEMESEEEDASSQRSRDSASEETNDEEEESMDNAVFNKFALLACADSD